MSGSLERMPLLSVQNLRVQFHTDLGVIQAVNGINFDLCSGETLGIVGESGCGKTVAMLALLRLIPEPQGKILPGAIVEFDGRNLLELSKPEIRGIRGRDISMIFQEPMTALNPVFSVGTQIVDILRTHLKLQVQKARQKAIELLRLVNIPDPEKRFCEYPHQMSGGMRQRVMIAMAMSCGPKLMIADEPTTALDVTTQVQVLEEIKNLQKRFNMALILVTHNLGLIAETCSNVMVMYCGKVVEKARVADLFRGPRHPYTVGLMRSLMRIREEKVLVLPTIDGMVPDLLHLPQGCVFYDRCLRRKSDCQNAVPELIDKGQGHAVACFFPEDAVSGNNLMD